MKKCFAEYDGDCVALRDKYCRGTPEGKRACPFYKTAKELDEERAESETLLQMKGLGGKLRGKDPQSARQTQ